MVHLCCMEDRIMTYNDWLWTVIDFPISFTGLVQASTLEINLKNTKDKLIDFSLSEDGKKLHIKGSDFDNEMPILVDQDYCKTIKARIPEDRDWHEITDDLFDALKESATFASDDFMALNYNSIFVKGDRVYSSEYLNGAKAMYQLKDKVPVDFSIPKFQYDWIKDYFREWGKRELKWYRVEPMEKVEGKGFRKLVHFKGDEITLSVKSRGISEMVKVLEETFDAAKEDIEPLLELPKGMSETLKNFDTLLKEDSISQDSRTVILIFQEGRIVCAPIMKEGGKTMKTFFHDHGLKPKKVLLGLHDLLIILKKTRNLIEINHEKGFLQFGTDDFRLLSFMRIPRRV